MSFQQTLQGGQPTATRMTREDNGYKYQGIKIAADITKSLIGSSYAEAQAEKGYEAALNDYSVAKQELSALETRLTDTTRQFETSGRPPELLAEMKSLEDTIRKARLGEEAGKLSGLSAKARIDAATKSAIAKFPAFASELRVHRDAVTSGGVYQTAIAESENNMQIAAGEAERLAKEMNTYGLSYFNPQDRLTYMTQAAALGRIKMQNEFLKGSLEPLKTQLDLKQAQLNYEKGVWDFTNSKEDRDLDVKAKFQQYANSVIAGQQSEFNYNRSVRMSPYNDRKDIADAYIAEGQRSHYDIMNPLQEDKARRDAEYDSVMNPIRIAEAKASARKSEQAEARAMSIKSLGNRGKALVDTNIIGMVSRLTLGDLKGLTPEEKAGHLALSKTEALRELDSIFLENGGLESPEYKAQRQMIEDATDGFKTALESNDPVKAQERLVKMRKLGNVLGAYDHPNFKVHMLYTDIGMGNTFDTLSKMYFEAVGNPSTAVAKQQTEVVKNLMELYQYPEELQKQLGIVSSTGQAPKNYKEETELAVSLGIKSLPTAGLTPEQIASDAKLANHAKVAMDGAYGLETMTTQGATLYARSSETGKQQYLNSFVDKFNQVAAMLPDGYTLKYDKGGSLAVVQTTVDKGEQVVATYDSTTYQDGTGIAAAASGVKGLREFANTAGVDLQGAFGDGVDDLQYIIKNNKDLIPESLSFNRANNTKAGVSKEQTVGFMTQLSNFTEGAVNPIFKAGENMTKSDTAIAMEDFLTKNYKAPGEAVREEKAIIDAYIAKGSDYADSYNEASRTYGVPVDLLIRQGGQESDKWSKDVVEGKRLSPAKAKGVAQFMEDAARQMGLVVNDKVDERTDPHKSIMAQAKYMKWLYDQTGDWKSATAAYNMGIGAWNKFKAGKQGIPAETVKYTKIITGGYE